MWKAKWAWTWLVGVGLVVFPLVKVWEGSGGEKPGGKAGSCTAYLLRDGELGGEDSEHKGLSSFWGAAVDKGLGRALSRAWSCRTLGERGVWGVA